VVLPCEMHQYTFLGVEDDPADLENVVPVIEVALCNWYGVSCGLGWGGCWNVGVIHKCMKALVEAVAVVW